MIAPVENFRLMHALAYASRGWIVFPVFHPMIGPSGGRCSCGKSQCASPAKHPMVKSWQDEGSNDPGVLRQWWERWPGANVGLVCGERSGIVVLDVDAGSGGVETMQSISARHGRLPETARAKTGGGGYHFLFKHPGRRVKNSVGEKGWLGLVGVDIRGDGGFIVAPPSLHVSEHRYIWAENGDPDLVDLADMPGWLLKRLEDSEKPAPVVDRAGAGGSSYEHWLGQALAGCNVGNRNDKGFWLACQLRDNRVSELYAQQAMRMYAERCPRGNKPYTQAEALASLRSAYADPPREPARVLTRSHGRENGEQFRRAPVESRPQRITVDGPDDGASVELARHMTQIVDGRIYNVPFGNWPVLTRSTQALVPGAITMICGDPGVGKTFLVTQALCDFVANDFNPAALFIEHNRVFYTQRLLAQLEGRGCFVDWEWIKANADEVDAATKRHAAMIDLMGQHIWSQPKTRITLGGVGQWIRDRCAEGRRLIIVDPITAADAGDKRWLADDDFVLGIKKVITDAGASLILVTHPKGNFTKQNRSGYGQAGGSAYFKFSQTDVWIVKTKQPCKVELRRTREDVPFRNQLSIFAEIHKATNGRGAGNKIGFEFNNLKFAEQGVVMREIKSGDVEQEITEGLSL